MNFLLGGMRIGGKIGYRITSTNDIGKGINYMGILLVFLWELMVNRYIFIGQ